jgi:hypothetical protein
VSPTLDRADIARAVTGLRGLLEREQSDKVRAAAGRALADVERQHPGS